ncbi:MAG: hypothetical protein ACHQ49_14945 [Elusimicrobiota bacterium]
MSAPAFAQRAPPPVGQLVQVSTFAAAPAPAVEAALEGRLISKVVVTDNRTALSVLSPRIALKEGRPFHQSDVERTRRGLYAMRLFKRVEIESKLDANGGVDVAIVAQDGWYVLPLPFVFSGGGGSGASLMVMERNYFGRAESIYAGESFNSAGSSTRLGGGYLRWSGGASYGHYSYTQYGYSNGSFNTENFLESSRNLNNPSQYGAVVSSFNRSVQSGSASVQYALTSHWRAGLGFTESLVSYSQQNGFAPNDAGHQNWVEGRLGWSALVLGERGDFGLSALPTPWNNGGAAMTDMVGSIFGLGLADVGERIRPLSATRLRLGGEATVDAAGAATGSDFDFTKLTARGSAALEFPQRHTLSLQVTGSEGFELPFSQGIPTNGALGMRGTYIREFFGAEGVGASLGGSYLLHQSKRGVLSADAFVESATVASGPFGGGGTQNGVGGGFHYTFWRFPLPIGLGYTYSLTDRDGQVSFAAGGRFGG